MSNGAYGKGGGGDTGGLPGPPGEGDGTVPGGVTGVPVPAPASSSFSAAAVAVRGDRCGHRRGPGPSSPLPPGPALLREFPD